MLLMKPLPAEHHGAKAGNDAHGRPTLQPGVHRRARATPLKAQAGQRRATTGARAHVGVSHALPGRGAVSLLEPPDLEGTLARHTRVFTAWSKAVICTSHTAMSDLHLATATQRPTIVRATAVWGAIGHPERPHRGLGCGGVSQGLHTRIIPVRMPTPCACSAWAGSCATGLLRLLAEGVKGDAWRHPAVC